MKTHDFVRKILFYYVFDITKKELTYLKTTHYLQQSKFNESSWSFPNLVLAGKLSKIKIFTVMVWLFGIFSGGAVMKNRNNWGENVHLSRGRNWVSRVCICIPMFWGFYIIKIVISTIFQKRKFLLFSTPHIHLKFASSHPGYRS